MKNEKIHVRKMIEVFYYPQCPWVAPVLLNLREITKELNLTYSEINLFQCPSPICQRFLIVKVDGKKVPIEVGTSDKEYTKSVVAASIEGKSTLKPEIVEYENSAEIQPNSTEEIDTLEFVTIQSPNILDVVSLCISEDFIYGSLPKKYTDKAKEMREQWLESLIDRFGFTGIIAYGDRKAVGFIEAVPGRLSEGMGMSSFNPPEKTWVILCLSITKKYWGQGIASMLLEKTMENLKGKTQWIEVWASKKGYWHPSDFYRRRGFSISKDVGNIWIMSRMI
ncbi:MAG: hypothetical protein DDT32_01654 [Syntrophomonadaceae bacterium]|nr:hypothetical protein [Bacillota bacterium]